MKKKCSECASGEIDNLAELLVLIIDDAREGKKRPCKKWICNEHADMLANDGTEFKVIKRI